MACASLNSHQYADLDFYTHNSANTDYIPTLVYNLYESTIDKSTNRTVWRHRPRPLCCI